MGNETTIDPDLDAMGNYEDIQNDESIPVEERAALKAEEPEPDPKPEPEPDIKAEESSDEPKEDESAEEMAASSDTEDAPKEDETEEDQTSLLKEETTPAQIEAKGDPEDLGKQIVALDLKYDDGEIENAEYRQKRDELLTQKIQAETYAKINEETTSNAWEAVQRRFFVGDNAKFASPDHPALRGAFQNSLQAVYQQEDAAGQSYEWYLEQALAIVKKDLGITDKAVKPSPSDKEKIKDAVEGRKKEAPDIPTLSDVPAAGENKPGEDKYADLDAMEGLELERHIAAMPEAERDKYLSSL